MNPPPLKAPPSASVPDRVAANRLAALRNVRIASTPLQVRALTPSDSLVYAHYACCSALRCRVARRTCLCPAIRGLTLMWQCAPCAPRCVAVSRRCCQIDGRPRQAPPSHALLQAGTAKPLQTDAVLVRSARILRDTPSAWHAEGTGPSPRPAHASVTPAYVAAAPFPLPWTPLAGTSPWTGCGPPSRESPAVQRTPPARCTRSFVRVPVSRLPHTRARAMPEGSSPRLRHSASASAAPRPRHRSPTTREDVAARTVACTCGLRVSAYSPGGPSPGVRAALVPAVQQLVRSWQHAAAAPVAHAACLPRLLS